jgi:hypothetical protein
LAGVCRRPERKYIPEGPGKYSVGIVPDILLREITVGGRCRDLFKDLLGFPLYHQAGRFG